MRREGLAMLMLLAALLPWQSTQAQGGNVCPPLPEGLAQRRNAAPPLPPPSPAEREAATKYMDYIRVNDWAFLCRYQDENRALTGRPRVVLFGDSITENWRAFDPGLFTGGIVGRGISGQTSSQMLVRFSQDVIALRPAIVHIMAGTNDIAGNTGPTTDRQFQDNIRAMTALAKAHGIRVILASIPPAAAFPWKPGIRPAARIRAWNGWLRDLARAEGLVYVDYHASLADDQGGMRAGLAGDGVHPTPAGYRQMDPLFRRALAQAERR
ncbi:SGNH/GDSL hydrolase family protein [Sphingomonas quercus]|uniref:SGNH/GDSL hydrolase family protein n=1 Tax=Sphingomonas quercus TaxID=2842451 RepID=A0ABS6BFN6_9SPHN|nr:SGNH/GDSL hydrolase family protein [Sphingomonas quercus]MBU3076296.1 SGNH/GDSL hydrolase family protein [Sphingomonas quercus]